MARCLSATQKTYNTVGSRLLRRRPRYLGVPLRWRSPKSYHPTHTNAANQATFPKKHWPTNAFKRFTPTPKRFSLAAGKPQDKAFHRRKKAFQREDHGSSRQSKAFQRREIRALPARKGISGAKQGTKQRRKWRSQPAGNPATQGISAPEKALVSADRHSPRAMGFRWLGKSDAEQAHFRAGKAPKRRERRRGE